jgi:hypothetical protein
MSSTANPFSTSTLTLPKAILWGGKAILFGLLFGAAGTSS